MTTVLWQAGAALLFGIPVVILWISLTTACSGLRSLMFFFFFNLNEKKKHFFLLLVESQRLYLCIYNYIICNFICMFNKLSITASHADVLDAS